MKRLLAAMAAALALACAHAAPGAALKAGVFAPARAAPEPALASSSGAPFLLSAQRGKVVVLAFGYTHCIDVCPVSLAALVQARALLGADAARVQVVFVTVDPARDDAARLRAYLAQFDPGFIGLTGSARAVDAALAAYGIQATRKPVAGTSDYTMHHASYLYFVDRAGLLRALMPFGRPPADIAHDLRLLLEGAP